MLSLQPNVRYQGNKADIAWCSRAIRLLTPKRSGLVLAEFYSIRRRQPLGAHCRVAISMSKRWPRLHLACCDRRQKWTHRLTLAVTQPKSLGIGQGLSVRWQAT